MKKEQIISLIDECEDIVNKCLENNDYATGVFFNLGLKAEMGNIEAVLKIGIITALSEEKGLLK